jgi:hypothetical protein
VKFLSKTGKIPIWFIVYFALGAFAPLITNSSIQVSFTSTESIYDSVNKGLLSENVVKMSVLGNSVKNVGFSPYISSNGNFSKDYFKAKARDILYKLFAPLFLLIVSLADNFHFRSKMVMARIFIIAGVIFSTFVLLFCIIDIIWLKNYFFADTLIKLPYGLIYNSFDSIFKTLFAFGALVASIFTYRELDSNISKFTNSQAEGTSNV